VIGGSVPASLGADWLAPAWDQPAGLYLAGPAASVVEEVAGDWLADLPAIADLAQEAGAWLHVDGAFGMWAAASPSLRHLVEGVERADSWASDAHKW
jgi:glutamate/tyrosine decarboxylase-like PLP-dependent enzyme